MNTHLKENQRLRAEIARLQEIIDSLQSHHQQPVDLSQVHSESSGLPEPEKPLKLDQSYFEQLFESVPAGIVLLDKDDHIIDCNNEFTRLFQYTREEARGKAINDLIVPDHLKDEGLNATMMVSSGQSISFETNRQRKDGQTFPVAIKGKSLKIRSGQLAVIGVYQDISERVAHERVMNYQDKMLRLLVNLATDFINIPPGKLDEAINEMLADIGGFIDADRIYVFKHNFSEKITTNTHEWCAPGVSPQIDNLQSTPFEFFHDFLDLHQKGAIVEISDVDSMPENHPMRPVFKQQQIRSLILIPLLQEGQCFGFVGFDSVKKIKVYDEKETGLLKFAAEIISNALSRQKTIKELVIAKEKAEESDRLKTAFLNNISHEIRTPLNAIMGFSEVLGLGGLNDEKTAHYTSIIIKSGNQLLSIIDDIINISSIEAGLTEAHYSQTDINDILLTVYHQLKPLAENKSLELLLAQTLPASDACALTDSTKLTQIVTNLLHNALKFTQKGQVSFGVVRKKGALQFFVSDTGPGIPVEEQENIFGRFRQGGTQSDQHRSGMGLGLSISKSFVELLGGNIWLETENGKGTTFYFTING